MKHNNNFKYDLRVGQVKERELANILEHKHIEVKRCTNAKYNVFVEYKSRGKSSGLSTTKADYYCFALKNSMVLLTTQRLKQICRPYYGTPKDVLGGDNNTSKGILVPINELVA